MVSRKVLEGKRKIGQDKRREVKRGNNTNRLECDGESNGKWEKREVIVTCEGVEPELEVEMALMRDTSTTVRVQLKQRVLCHRLLFPLYSNVASLCHVSSLGPHNLKILIKTTTPIKYYDIILKGSFLY
jgi:hypothetical protein